MKDAADPFSPGSNFDVSEYFNNEKGEDDIAQRIGRQELCTDTVGKIFNHISATVATTQPIPMYKNKTRAAESIQIQEKYKRSITSDHQHLPVQEKTSNSTHHGSQLKLPLSAAGGGQNKRKWGRKQST